MVTIVIIPFNFLFDFVFEEVLNAPTLHQVEQHFQLLKEKETVTFERYKLSLRKAQRENVESGIDVDHLKKPEDRMSFEKFQQRFEGEQKSNLRYEHKYHKIDDSILSSRLLAVTTCGNEFPICKHVFPEPWYDEEILDECGELKVSHPPIESQQNKVFSFNETNKDESSKFIKKANFASFFEDFTRQYKEMVGEAKEDFELRWG